MTKQVKHPVTDKWLRSLTGPQVRALSHQHGVQGALTLGIKSLRGDLINLPAVQEIASEFDGKEII